MRKTGFVFASASLLALCISMTPAASDNMRQPGGMGGGGGGGFGRGGGGGFGGGGFGGGGFGGGFGGGIDVGNAFGQAIDTIDKAQRPPPSPTRNKGIGFGGGPIDIGNGIGQAIDVIDEAQRPPPAYGTRFKWVKANCGEYIQMARNYPPNSEGYNQVMGMYRACIKMPLQMIPY